MKHTSALTLLLIAIGISITYQQCRNSNASPVYVNYKDYLANKISIGCAPGNSVNEEWKNDVASVPALSGWGNFKWKVTTTNDSAQFYFNQGISMYYSFHMIEAKASFAKAALLDNDCAMAYWGLAMAYGVNYNNAVLKNAPEAMEAMANAAKAVNNESELERALVATLPARYNADTTVSRMQQNKDYAAAIESVHKRFPVDANLAALHADALMVQHPWDLYDIKGDPKPWTPAIVTLLEAALKEHPTHPSLNHLYIHAVEAASDAAKALPNAWRLTTMMPFVSHMVHMPSHIFIRTGYYKEGMLVNDSSVKGFNAYMAAFPSVEDDAALYLLHNLHMKAACTLYRGSQAEAYQAATDLTNVVPSAYLQVGGGLGNYIQYVYATPMFMQVRFGWWDSLLAAPRIHPDLKYLYVVQTFAKGMANARKGNMSAAKAMMKELNAVKDDPEFKAEFEATNPAIKSVHVMVALLTGNIALAKKDIRGAKKAFELAVEEEDQFIYGEPRDWLLPTRHYLSAILLQEKDYAAAENVINMELVINPGNIWSLYGLMAAQKGLQKNKEAATTKAAFDKAFLGSDIKMPGTVF